MEQVVAGIQRDRPRLVFVCNPNNPTGGYLDAGAIEKLAGACGSSTLLVLDEAYRAFIDGQFYAELPGEHCLVLRSMTKDFALAGLRLGYAVGSPGLIEQLEHFQPAWSVNSVAQAAGIAALAEVAYYRRTLMELIELKNDLFSQIRALGYALVRSDAHFGLIHAGGPAQDLRLRLLRLSLQVRDCASFGLPEYIRIGARKRADNMKLLEALQLLRKE